MKPPADGRQARVLGAALRNWASHTADPGPPAVRLQIRQPPDWSYVNAVDLTDDQYQRLLAFLRDDLTAYQPEPQPSPGSATRAFDGYLAELRVAGHTRLTAAELLDAAPRVGRSRTWIAQHVTHLIDTGQLRETRRPGVFRI
ncbi:hypothetical protein [Streptantibioticus silvisoli]|uniref:Uncharacterized protein n=1 Tax=Streptantibioticus silvisoli TaxID=2705255 RepID=A0ABT6W8R3_9ACTN|nr:hypothetical protein [Streptantibioticus silvisoli]MDI5967152.1 hypothetical protein [Streptantibioticus silvisoli]